ncbi:MAG TPA: hypothetical protein VFP86_07480 [bacterium]|nr:hypothetical protein [bacterium]
MHRLWQPGTRAPSIAGGIVLLDGVRWTGNDQAADHIDAVADRGGGDF